MKRDKSIKTLSLILFFFICLTGPAKAIEWAELNPLGRVDWATWDPIGKGIFRPLEEIFPKLKLRGFIENETDILLHRRPFDDLNLPKVSYNLPKIQWLFELEAHYHFTEDVELGLITHMLYDAAFDWDQLYKKNFKSTRATLPLVYPIPSNCITIQPLRHQVTKKDRIRKPRN